MWAPIPHHWNSWNMKLRRDQNLPDKSSLTYGRYTMAIGGIWPGDTWASQVSRQILVANPIWVLHNHEFF